MITVIGRGFHAYRVMVLIAVQAVRCLCATVSGGGQGYTIAVFRKMCPYRRVPCQDEGKGIGGRKAVVPCICPFHKMMITVTGNGFRTHRVPIRISKFAVRRLYRVIAIGGGQGYMVVVFLKMRLNDRVLCQGKGKGIGGRKAVASFICPFHKMMITVTGDGFRTYRVSMRIIELAFQRPYRVIAVFYEQGYMVGVFLKMRLKDRVPCQNERKESIGGKAVVLCVCPFHKMITVNGDSFHTYRVQILIAVCAVRCHYAVVFDVEQGYRIAVFRKMRLNGRVPCQGEGKEGVGGKAFAPCVCPFLKMITVIGEGFHAYRVLILIAVQAVRYLYATVFDGGQGYRISVFRKMRLKGRVPCQNERKESVGGKVFALCVCPFIKMITVIGGGFHTYRVQIHIIVWGFHFLCPAVFGGQGYRIAVFRKMRLNGRVPCQGEGKESVGGKAFAPCICPFLQMITVIGDGFHAHRVLILIAVQAVCAVQAVRYLYATVFDGGQGYRISVFLKMRLNDRVPYQNERKERVGG
ncbi:hypothetical protein Barb4_04687 [Bacteroidales bacterium Barb4]|nr:hypothetical protein Barb4_04687 [Bacteroidales bacterium Barb4]